MKICVHSVISLIISIISAVSFCLLFELSGFIKEAVRVIWYISSALCIVYPIFSKYCRKKGGLLGRRLEITALVIAFWTFQFLLIYAIGTNDIVNLALVITCYIIYSKTSNNLISEKEVQFNTTNISNKNFLNGVNADDGSVAENEETFRSAETKLENTKDKPPLQNTSITPAKPKKAKPHFCKYCGNPIDQATKKCTGCQKQYFRFPIISKSKVTFIAVVLVSVMSIVFCIYQMLQYRQQISDLNAQITQLNTDLDAANQSADNLKERLVKKTTENAKLSRDYNALKSDLNFFNRHVVFVLNDGMNVYHKYDCVLFENSRSSFWAYNTEAAASRGYKPCSVCHK